MKEKTTWAKKLADSKGLPKIGRVEGTMTTRWGTGTMVIPAPIVPALRRKLQAEGHLVADYERSLTAL